jgi:methyl-accepting chemotaxis protein
MNLSRKIALFVGVLLLVVSLGLGFTAVYFAGETVEEEVESALVAASDAGAREVEISVSSNLRVLQEVANRAEMTGRSWADKRNSLLPDVERLGYLDMAVVDPDGTARYVLSGDVASLGDRSYVQRAFAGEPNLSDVLISRVTGEAVLMYAVPIYQRDEVVSVLIARRDGNSLNEITDGMGVGDMGYAYTINSTGTTVAHPDREMVMNQVNVLARAEEDPAFADVARSIEKALAEGRGVDTYDYNGRTNYAAYAPIPGTEWILVNVAVEEEVLANLASMRSLLMLITGGFLVAGILAALFLGSSIAKPITLLSASVERIANFDLSEEGEDQLACFGKRRDEVGTIARSVETMRLKLRALVEEIAGGAESVSASSEELTATSQQSATAADEVARTIEEIARGATDQAKETQKGAEEVHALGEIVNEDIRLVRELNTSAVEMSRLKDQGVDALSDLREKTRQNNEAAQEVHGIIIETDGNTEKIERASDMIKSIADQTNLLALNAAIEAARAGDAGRGFAVVAEEIRKLAEQSNTFAEEISQIIAGLSQQTAKAVKTMNAAGQIVAAQMESMETTHQKFDGIAGAIESVRKIVDELNASSSAMTEKKEEIVRVIENLSAISEENAAGTEEASASVEEQTAAMAQIADASEGLAELAGQLQSQIRQFKL